jgi:hypothetical protein
MACVTSLQVEVLCNCRSRVGNGESGTHRAFVPYRVAHRVFPVEVMVSACCKYGMMPQHCGLGQAHAPGMLTSLKPISLATAVGLLDR